MQIRYLCPKHENWVYENPNEAVHVLARDELQGTLLLNQGRYSDAIPYLGCALDIAFILLDVSGGENKALTHKVSALCEMLSGTYHHLQLPAHQHAIEERLTHTLTAVTAITLNSEHLHTTTNSY